MTVEIWFRDAFDTEKVQGDLTNLTNHLNVGAANGKQFIILEDEQGEAVMVQTTNINKAREVGSDSFVG